jgi:hypothetical protein
MSLARQWDEPWSPLDEYRRHLEVVPALPVTPLRVGITVSRRRAARARMLRRRRRTALALAVAVSIIVLAWPGHAFGGVNSSGVLVDQTSRSPWASGMVYTVQSHDSISSI